MTNDLTFGKIQMAIREGSSDPLHVWFYGGVFGVGGSNGVFPFSANPRWRLGGHLEKFKWRYLRCGSSDWR